MTETCSFYGIIIFQFKIVIFQKAYSFEGSDYEHTSVCAQPTETLIIKILYKSHI